jgi:hypothetical protein
MDIVPSLPPDDSFPVKVGIFQIMPSFAHVGQRVFFQEIADIAPQSTNGRDRLLDDQERFKDFYQVTNGLFVKEEFAKSILNALVSTCSPVRDHIVVLSAIQSVVWAKSSDDGSQKQFFETWLTDPKGEEILWGYEDWCSFIKSVKS